MIEIEKTGKPAIPIVSGRFEEDAIASSRAFAMPDLQFVIVPRIYRNLAPELCVSQTEAVIDEIIEVLTVDKEHGRRERDTTTAVERFEGDDRWDAILRMNEQWLMRDWGDAMVLHPPTEEAVVELIAGTGLDRHDLVCDMPPGFGLATVEKIAINSAMAGAKPEHMPVIIAAVKALSEVGEHGGKSLLMSTSPHAPMLVVNGPIAKELGINPRSGLGPGRDNEVNITIGRAFSLCLRNLGYWYPGQMDMDTIGTTRKFVHCIAENEEMSPWEPFHVNQGFRADESAVSVFITDGELDVQDQGNTDADDLLKTIAYGSTFGTRGMGARHTNERLIFMPPGCRATSRWRRLLQAGSKAIHPPPCQHESGQIDALHAHRRRPRRAAVAMAEGQDRAGEAGDGGSPAGERRSLVHRRGRRGPCQDARDAHR